MTRKDYILIAAALRRAIDPFPTVLENSAATCTWLQTVRHVADALARDNPQFNRAKFLTACGVN